MKRFKKLLAVVNGGPGDPHVTYRAIALAKANRAQLMFCAIHEAPGPAAGLLAGSEQHTKLDRVLRQERRDRLNEAVGGNGEELGPHKRFTGRGGRAKCRNSREIAYSWQPPSLSSSQGFSSP